MLYKAHRIRSIRENYKLSEPMLRTLVRDRDSLRVREIKAGEDTVRSLYDVIYSEGTEFRFYNENREPMEKMPRGIFYNDIDALEENILFAEENVGPRLGLVAGGETNNLNKLESEGPDMTRFVYDLDTDDELPDDEAHDKHRCGKSSADDSDWEDDMGSDNDDEDENSIDNEELQDGLAPADEETIRVLCEYVKRHTMSGKDSSENMYEQWTQFVRREASKGMPHMFDHPRRD